MTVSTTPIPASIVRRTAVVADPNFLFRRGLRSLLEKDGSVVVVGEAETADDLARQLIGSSIDLVILSQKLLDSAELSPLLEGKDAICLLDEEASGLEIPHVKAVLKSTASSQLLASLSQLPARAATPEPTAPALPSARRLTRRELDVIAALCSGCTVRQAAAELNLSWKTVESHALNLMRKLDIHDRSHLLRFAQENGLAPVRS